MVRVLNPDRGGRTTIQIVACCALITQFRNLRPNLAQLVKGVVQLGVEHDGQVDHAVEPEIASPSSETITPPALPVKR
jgi:hypothetical protein